MITACGFVTFHDQVQYVWGFVVATVITACGFVTFLAYFLRSLNAFLRVATVITACGFVTESCYCNEHDNGYKVATVITACGFVT